LCDLDNLGLTAGTYTAVTTTYTKANNRVDNLLSESFRIDSTAPMVLVLDVENSVNDVVGSTVKAAAEASDDSDLESVNFYVTEPRHDGACTGNGTKLAEFR